MRRVFLQLFESGGGQLPLGGQEKHRDCRRIEAHQIGNGLRCHPHLPPQHCGIRGVMGERAVQTDHRGGRTVDSAASGVDLGSQLTPGARCGMRALQVYVPLARDGVERRCHGGLTGGFVEPRLRVLQIVMPVQLHESQKPEPALLVGPCWRQSTGEGGGGRCLAQCKGAVTNARRGGRLLGVLSLQHGLFLKLHAPKGIPGRSPRSRAGPRAIKDLSQAGWPGRAGTVN